MKLRHKILVAVIALLALQFVASAQEAIKGVHWYSFDIEHHNAIAATSSLTPEQLAKALAGAEFIRLDSAREFNGAGDWNIPKAPFTETLFVRPATVRSFVPLTGPPTNTK
jgi:hypothetical protein